MLYYLQHYLNYYCIYNIIYYNNLIIRPLSPFFIIFQ
jgi:hypothetical protein